MDATRKTARKWIDSLSTRVQQVLFAAATYLILLAICKAHTPLFEYTPNQVKQAVVGYGSADKHQVMEMTRRLLGLREVPKPDDTADALALTICHGQMGGTALKRRLVSGR